MHPVHILLVITFALAALYIFTLAALEFDFLLILKRLYYLKLIDQMSDLELGLTPSFSPCMPPVDSPSPIVKANACLGSTSDAGEASPNSCGSPSIAPTLIEGF
jgi:hypothetical protein